MQSQAYNQHEESAIKKTAMKIIEEASQLKKFKVMIHCSEDKDFSIAIAKSMHEYHHAFMETAYKMIISIRKTISRKLHGSKNS